MLKKTINGQYRQGDVLIQNGFDASDIGDEIPKEDGRVVLAHGEVTGHAHAFVSSSAKHFLAKSSKMKTYLKLVEPAALRHEEHAEVPIKEKKKEVRIQRQWSTERIRQVQD